MIINFLLFSLASQILHHFLSRSKNKHEKYEWLKLFSVLSGEMIPANIGLTHEEDLRKLVKRLDYIINYDEN
jgi:hypothetical protein